MVRYLTDQGWTRQSSRDGKLVRLYLGKADAADTVNLIFSNTSPPEEERSEVSAALDTLEQLYGRPRSQLTRAISSLPYDLILTRIPDEYVRHESIELGTAQTYMRTMHSFIAASATTEISGEV